jgi:hypothetical protein
VQAVIPGGQSQDAESFELLLSLVLLLSFELPLSLLLSLELSLLAKADGISGDSSPCWLPTAISINAAKNIAVIIIFIIFS